VSLEVVHRDINPSNVFLTYGGQVKVIDFGLAKALDRLTSTVAGVVKGKLAYLSPEQVTGLGVDRRSDIFSLGTTLWEISCDRRLFKKDSDAETMVNVQNAKVPDPTKLAPGYPPELAKIVLRALAKDRNDRYPTAAELARDLESFAGAGGRIVTPATVLEIMADLFPRERDRDARWFEGAGTPISTVPLAPIKLSSEELKTEYGTLEAVQVTELPSAELKTAYGEDAIQIAPAESVAREPSVSVSQGDIAGLPKGTMALLSSGELAMFGALGMLVVVAVVVAFLVLGK